MGSGDSDGGVGPSVGSDVSGEAGPSVGESVEGVWQNEKHSQPLPVNLICD